MEDLCNGGWLIGWDVLVWFFGIGLNEFVGLVCMLGEFIGFDVDGLEVWVCVCVVGSFCWCLMLVGELRLLLWDGLLLWLMIDWFRVLKKEEFLVIVWFLFWVVIMLFFLFIIVKGVGL